MKIILVVIVLLIVVFFVWKFVMTKPPQDLPQANVVGGTQVQGDPLNINATQNNGGISGVDMEKSFVKITGYGPGKEHPVSFAWSDSLAVTDGILSGSVVFDLVSVKTDNGGLDKHLCSEDFFNCAVNKTVELVITQASTNSITGTMIFAGQSHTVTFPVTVQANTVAADFRLDRTLFNFKYTLANVTAVDKEVRVEFMMVGK